MRRVLLAVSLAVCAFGADSLEAILLRMDKGAKEFKSVAAKLKEVSYNAVLEESTTQTGDLLLRRAKNGLMGVLHFNPPEETTIGFSGQKVEKYYPKMNQVDVINVGKNAAQIDQFILLAFGAAGSDLQKSYDIKLAGTETVEGVSTTHLELTPKSPEARKFATRIELWIPQGKSNAIQEKVLEPSDNYVLTTYSDIKPNPQVPDSAFELKTPPDVKRINVK